MTNPMHARRVVRDVLRAGAVLSAAMFFIGVTGALGDRQFAAAAAINGGNAQVLVPPGSPSAGQPLNSGGSATGFALTPPVGAACTGDTATDGYKVQSYMVPAAIDPATLTYDANGPIPAGTGASFRQPLFSQGTPFVNKNTAVATGLLTGLPTFSFGLFGAAGPTIVPEGTYNIGYACTLGTASATQLDKYWNVQLTFVHDPQDSPAGITWTVGSGTSPTTTSTSSSTTTSTTTSTTSTTVVGVPTSTSTSTSTTTSSTVVTGGSTSTSTSTTHVVVASTTTIRSGTGNGRGGLPRTGSSPFPTAVWGILALVLGRMVMLVARPLKVIPFESR